MESGERSFDFGVALGSLPLFYRRRLESFPLHAGYLLADASHAAAWRERLDRLGDGLKVGLAWQGGLPRTGRVSRTLRLEQLLLHTRQRRQVARQRRKGRQMRAPRRGLACSLAPPTSRRALLFATSGPNRRRKYPSVSTVNETRLRRASKSETLAHLRPRSASRAMRIRSPTGADSTPRSGVR